MLTKWLAAAVVGSALIAAPALAQTTNQSGASNAPKAQLASATGLWQSSKLIGTNVYNPQNEKIGDIKELMADKSGKIDTVVIGVGGFLGMGTHDVAVKFSELKWVDEPVNPPPASGAVRPGGAGTTGTATIAPRAEVKRNYPDHAVLNASKDQLKSMPQFDYSK